MLLSWRIDSPVSGCTTVGNLQMITRRGEAHSYPTLTFHCGLKIRRTNPSRATRPITRAFYVARLGMAGRHIIANILGSIRQRVLCLILCSLSTTGSPYLSTPVSRLLNSAPLSLFFLRFFNSTTFLKALVDQLREIRHLILRRWITYSGTSYDEVWRPTPASVRLVGLLQMNLPTRCPSGVLFFSLALPSSSC